MNSNILFDALKELNDNGKRKKPMHIWLDESTGEIKEELLKDMSASALIGKKQNPAKEIHDFIFSTIY